MSAPGTCWMGVIYNAPHTLGSEPERCLMCAVKKAEDATVGPEFLLPAPRMGAFGPRIMKTREMGTAA